ncbi:MAG: type II toxin-antitoxin system RelE/ParE family toxin [Chloroflexota bacterium]
MNYHVTITPTAAKEFRGLDAKQQRRISDTLRQLTENPRPPGAKKLTGSKSDWRVRVGDYRILYEVDDTAAHITVWRIAHRREVYRG